MRNQTLYRKLRAEYDTVIDMKLLDNIKEMSAFRAVPQQQHRTNHEVAWKAGAALTVWAAGVAAFTFLPNLVGNSDTLASLENGSFVQVDNDITGSTSDFSDVVATIPKWEERTISSQFDRIDTDGGFFTATQETLNSSDINELLFTTTLTGYDLTDPNYYLDITKAKQYKKDVEVYSVKSIGSEFLLAIKYDGYEGFYSFIPGNYNPETLGDFIEDLNLRENLAFSGMLNYDREYPMSDEAYPLPDSDYIWDFLLSNNDAVCQVPDELDNSGDLFTKNRININISMNIAGQYEECFSITENGYIFTNLYGSKTFYIGADKAKAFADYVLKHS